MSKAFLYTLFGLLILASILSVRYFLFYGAAGSEDQQMETIRRKTWSQVREMERESQAVRAALKQQPIYSFSSLRVETQHPYFVYRDGELIFWSDYRYVPDYSVVSGDYTYKTINARSGKYLAYQSAFNAGRSQIEIVSLLPLYFKYDVDNNYLQSQLNEEIIPYKDFQVGIDSTGFAHQHGIYSPEGQLLFMVQLPNAHGADEHTDQNLLVIGGMLAAILIGWLASTIIKQLNRNRQYELGFLVLAAYLIGLRAVMLHYGFPYSWAEWDLFNSKFYASSEITPSLGDLLVNEIVISGLLISVLMHFFKSRLYRLIIHMPRFGQVLLSVVVAGFSYWPLYLHFYILRTIYLHSQLTLDITASIDFSFFKAICILVFIINSWVYFASSHLQAVLFIRLNRGYVRPLVWFALGTVLYTFFSYATDIFYPLVILVHALYLALVIGLRLPKFLNRLRYATSIYLFTAALVCAGIGAFAVYNLEQRKHVENQQLFGAKQLAEHDELGEYLLNEAAKAIGKDAYIRTRLLGPFPSRRAIERKIREIHLTSHFDKYDVLLHVFNGAGEPVQPEGKPGTYQEMVAAYGKDRYKTDYPNLYFLNSLGGNVIQQYVSFIPITRKDSAVGYVAIDLKLKRIVPSNVYPELLTDKRFIPSPESRRYSYAIYRSGRLLYNEGGFNYRRYFNTEWLGLPQAPDPGITANDHLHIVVNGTDGKQIVVSALRYPVKSIFTNFSFLFILLVLCIVVFLIVITVRYSFSRANTSFATKIQIYLNLAFFMPLFVVSIATLSIINSAYQQNLTRLFLNKAESISRNIRGYADGYYKDKITRDAMQREIERVARYSETDVNLFNADGSLTLSSQPLIYDNSLLSRYLNPDAFTRLAESGDRYMMLAESVGALNYNSVYMGVRSYEDNQLIGIISIPFFGSKAELDQQMIDVLSTIMNIFTTIFICFLIFSYFASRVLTVPLRLITQKIRKTSLHNYNEPLEWDSDDEIGLLVNEYNRMLVNLEENKQALSRSEKESAWREMAQQVAHEIKNPLTPMKLTLQHLQRIFQRPDTHVKERTALSLGSLLEQVDTLSDIATSFSAFAKMPIPKEETFEINSVLHQTTDLYNNDDNVEVETAIYPEACYVKGDYQLMGRIFTNLILNGIQSVPSDRKPHIFVGLQKNSHTMRIEIRDNGVGIADNIKPRIFLPNFSTKFAGSGIGLALAKRGVEHAGGRIWFESEVDAGTSFFIELPVLSSVNGLNGKGH